MSDYDVSQAENVDTTDEGYANYLLSEKDKQINILRNTNKLLDEMVSEKGIDALNDKITGLQERVRKADKVIDIIYDGFMELDRCNAIDDAATKALKDYNNQS